MSYSNFVKEFRKRLVANLATKTGWGRVEVLNLVDNILLELSAESLDQKEFDFKP